MNTKIVRTVFVLLIFKMLMSCNSSAKDTYENYNIGGENWKSKKVYVSEDDITYVAVEVPIQYYILKNVGNDVGKIDSIYNKNIKERIIEVTFEHSDNKDLLLEDYTKKSYDNAVKYMASKIKDDFTILTNSNDTIECSGVHFERNFKVAPFKRILLYFNNINPDDYIKLIYKDSLFGKGTIKFNLDEIPLKL